MGVEVARPHRRIELAHRSLQGLRLQAELVGELDEAARRHGRLVGKHDRPNGLDGEGGLVTDEEGRLGLVAPDLEGKLLEGGIEAVLALIEEALRLAVDQDAVGEAIDHRVRLAAAAVDRLAVEHVELAGGGGAGVHGHADALAPVVGERGRDQGKLSPAPAQVLRQHLAVAFEAAAGDHHRRGCEPAQQPVAPAGHDAIDAPSVGKAEGHRLGLVDDFRPRRGVHQGGETVNDPDAAQGRHAKPAAGVAVGEGLLEEGQLNPAPFQEVERRADLPLQGAAVVQVGPSAGDLVHLADEVRIQPAVLGDAEPAAGPPRGAAAPLPGSALQDRDAGRTPAPSRGGGVADRRRQTRSAAADHHQVVVHAFAPISRPTSIRPAPRPSQAGTPIGE